MRLFVAIELSKDVRSMLAAVQHDLKPRCSDVRWVKPEQLHMTVKFLGDVADSDVAAVCEAVELAASMSREFELTLEGSGCFPKKGPVRIVWAGASEQTGALAQCVEFVENALEPLGFPRERKPFSPHITIGRVRFDRSDGLIRKVAESHSFRRAIQSVEILTLMTSELSPKGPTYFPAGQFPLSA